MSGGLNPYGRIIGIVGSRRRDSKRDWNAVSDAFLRVYMPGDWICSGGCPQGADRFAEQLHRNHAVPYLEFPAKWTGDNGRHNPSAGFERNTYIAHCSDVLIACVAPDRTGGTEDTIEKFQTMTSGGVQRPLILV